MTLFVEKLKKYKKGDIVGMKGKDMNNFLILNMFDEMIEESTDLKAKLMCSIIQNRN